MECAQAQTGQCPEKGHLSQHLPCGNATLGMSQTETKGKVRQCSANRVCAKQACLPSGRRIKPPSSAEAESAHAAAKASQINNGRCSKDRKG